MDELRDTVIDPRMPFGARHTGSNVDRIPAANGLTLVRIGQRGGTPPDR
jgi:hypothetical protein